MKLSIDAITNSLIANVATALVIAILPMALLVRQRRQIAQFFRVGSSREFQIYFSAIHVLSGGSTGADGQRRKYSGITISALENRSLIDFQQVFDFRPEGSRSFLASLLASVASRVNVEAMPAPAQPTRFDFSHSFLTLGSPGYNGVSAWIEAHLNPMARFDMDNGAVTTADRSFPAYLAGDVGFVQKIRIPQTELWCFYAAGVSEKSTRSAHRYLSQDWRELEKLGGHSKPFCVIFAVGDSGIDSRDILYSSVG